MLLRFYSKEHSDLILNKSIFDLLKKSTQCSIATTWNNDLNYINTVYFSFNKNLELFFLSDPRTQHCRNILKNSWVSIAVSDSRQVWQEPKQGLQLFGTCRMTRGTSKIRAEYNYIKRFIGYRDWIKILTEKERRAFTSKFFIIKVEWLKIFDEPTFGEEVYITLKIRKA
jgi:uncharacterized protein YhbP (UPF0306 family)